MKDFNKIFSSYLSIEQLVFYPRLQIYGGETTTPGQLIYTNIKSLLARFFITCHSELDRIENWRLFCIGITSRDYGASSNIERMHMPMFDYDGKNIKTYVKKQIKHLQKEYSLGDAWIYKTHGGLHVYFFTDLVREEVYLTILKHSNCCDGFSKITLTNKYGVLRISAKFTKFDIKLQYILRSKKRSIKRMSRKALLIQEMLKMGNECDTHFASLFPQWAYFEEDSFPWKQNKRKIPLGKIKSKKTFPKMPAIPPLPINYEPCNYAINNVGCTSNNTPITTDLSKIVFTYK